MSRTLLAFTLAALLIAGPAAAQLELTGSIAGGGGGPLESGTLSLEGSISDPLAAAPVEAGSFELVGGIVPAEDPASAVDDWMLLDN